MMLLDTPLSSLQKAMKFSSFLLAIKSPSSLSIPVVHSQYPFSYGIATEVVHLANHSHLGVLGVFKEPAEGFEFFAYGCLFFWGS